MTEHHPINPPPELVQQWLGEFFGCTVSGELSDSERFLAARAAQWGADMELEACCEWLKADGYPGTVIDLRAARRPKPLSLKEQALTDLDVIYTNQPTTAFDDHFDRVRRALESLPND